MTATNPSPGRLLKLADVEKETSLSRWTIRRRIRAGEFPKPLNLGGNRVAWSQTAVEDWKSKIVTAASA